uniref:Uncharacterized protein n=1 Tax=Solanum tuberosum TaxID=4113 RepID=M1AC71_SOLTU
MTLDGKVDEPHLEIILEEKKRLHHTCSFRGHVVDKFILISCELSSHKNCNLCI